MSLSSLFYRPDGQLPTPRRAGAGGAPGVCLAAALVVAAICAAGAARAQQAFFMGLGVTVPGTPGTADVSDDGSVVFASFGGQIHRWTKETGLVSLGLNRGAGSSNLFASGDGSVFFASNAGIGYRWNEQTGVTELGAVEQITDASSNGLAAVGMHANGAFRWTEQGGFQFLDLSAVDGGGHYPWGVSGDGSVVVGRVGRCCGPGAVGSYYGSWRWTEATGAVELETPPTYYGSNTNPVVSYDGSVVGGWLYYLEDDEEHSDAGRWTQATGWVGLERLENVRYAEARGLSDDGRRMLFAGNNQVDPAAPSSYLWDESHGIRTIEAALRDEYGLESSLTGWGSLRARRISGDGKTIVGYARNPAGAAEPWIAFLGDPVVANSADFDGDGTVTGADFLAWQRHVGLTSGATRAQGDANADGRVDAADLALWKSNFGPAAAAALATPPAPVPEPSAWALAGPALALLLAAARGRVSPRRDRVAWQASAWPWFPRFSMPTRTKACHTKDCVFRPHLGSPGASASPVWFVNTGSMEQAPVGPLLMSTHVTLFPTELP